MSANALLVKSTGAQTPRKASLMIPTFGMTEELAINFAAYGIDCAIEGHSIRFPFSSRMANDEVTTFSVALRELVQAFASTSRISPLEEAAFVKHLATVQEGQKGVLV